DRGVARHWKFGESLSGYARQRVEGVSLAVFPRDIVEEGAELGVTQLYARIRHRLDQRRELSFGCNRNARVVEDFQGSSFLPQLTDARFERLVQGEETDFQGL